MELNIKKRIYSPLSSLIFTIFTLIISMLSLVLVSLELANLVPNYLKDTFLFLDRVFSVIFFSEFIVRLLTAKKKLVYLRWGWIDFLSAVPLYEFKLLRLFKVVIILRILKSLYQLKRLKEIFTLHGNFQSKINNSFLAFVLLTLLTILISTVTILIFESEVPKALAEDRSHHIDTLEKALWWSVVTITTVGYGDLYPISVGGKITAIILMLFGIGLFSTLTIYFSSFLISRLQQNEQQKKMAKEILEVKKELKEIKKILKNNP